MYDVREALDALPPEFDARQAAAVKLTTEVLDRLVRNNRIARVQPGIFRRVVPCASGDRWQLTEAEHRSRLRAALLAHPSHAASHISAALLYEWPLRLHPDALVHLTALDVQPRSRRSAEAFLHHSDSMPNAIEQVDGVKVMTRARTVVDCLRTMRPPNGVAVADAALRRGDVTRDELQQVIDWQHRWVGRPRARRAMQLVDPRRESWLESYSFVALFESGIELPLHQVEVFDASYEFVARVDGLWLDRLTVAEADGEAKYGLSAASARVNGPEGAIRSVTSERRRERELTDLGLVVVRWTTDEITHDPARVARRVVAAWQRGDVRAFVGHLRRDGRWLDLPVASRRPSRPTEHRSSAEFGR